MRINPFSNGVLDFFSSDLFVCTSWIQTRTLNLKDVHGQIKIDVESPTRFFEQLDLSGQLGWMVIMLATYIVFRYTPNSVLISLIFCMASFLFEASDAKVSKRLSSESM